MKEIRVEKNMNQKRNQKTNQRTNARIDLETLCFYGLAASLLSVGVVLFIISLLGLLFIEVGTFAVCGWIFGLTGFIWATFVITKLNR